MTAESPERASDESGEEGEEERDAMGSGELPDELGRYAPLNADEELPPLGLTASSHPVYFREGANPLVFFCIHGAGLSASSFALLAREVAPFAGLAALDLPGHGRSPLHPRDGPLPDLSLQSLLAACFEALLHVHHHRPAATLVLLGHSLGGNLAVKLDRAVDAADEALRAAVVGLVVVDVVEGSATEALPFMKSFLAAQPQAFDSVAAAVRYVHRARLVRNLDSARRSVPDQLARVGDRLRWRVELLATERYWPTWFEALNRDFLACARPKILVLAQADRMDKELTIAQMQGRFKLVVLAVEVGHLLHEDDPRAAARELRQFLRQFRLPLGAQQLAELRGAEHGAFRNGL